MFRRIHPVLLASLLGFMPTAEAGLFDAVTEGISKATAGARDSGEKAVPNKPQATDVVSAQPANVVVTNVEALPKSRKIILSNFVVEFQQRYEKKSTGFSILGMGNAGSSTAINDATLPDPSVLQALTNFAYQDVIGKLKAQGYEVVEVTGLSDKSKSYYEKLTKTVPIKPGETFSNIDGESVLYSPEGMISSLPNAGCTHYGSEKSMANMSNNMRMASSGYQTDHENQIALAEGNVPLLKVWITVGFGDVTANGGNAFISSRKNDFLGTTKTTVANSANANATAGMYLKADVTRFAISVPTNTQYKSNHGCGMRLSKSTLLPPADGDVVIRLGSRLNYDNSDILSSSSEAGTVGITDRNIGGGVGIRSVKENSDGTQGRVQTNGQGTQLVTGATRTSGFVSASGNGITSLHSVSENATIISADNYASSTASMIHKATAALVEKLKQN